ncbi:phasin family protein [Ramlibacter algicola]|uniref:Phasin family protein n=1 Tax=Ramlibacter algicola TaxID=2795217 RepID=A0A934PYI4_9BURK|nr:phasin family protein [Ramlibacter algicola]MBK0391441.1 phasin family protein [Ramlibacter algicola]
MATSKRSTSTASTDADETQALGTTGAFAEASRQQMATAVESLGVMFRAAESLQQAQLHMAQRAALLHAQAAENIRKASSPVELVSIQSTLLLYEYQEAMRYWQELMGASAKAGAEMARRRAPREAADDGVATSPGAAMMGAAMSAAAPMADAFQQMFTAPLKAAQQAQQTH